MDKKIEQNKKLLKKQAVAINTEKLRGEKLTSENALLEEAIKKNGKLVTKAKELLESGEAFLLEKQVEIDILIAKKNEADKDLSEVLSVIEEREAQAKILDGKINDAKKQVNDEKEKITGEVEKIKNKAIKAINEILNK